MEQTGAQPYGLREHLATLFRHKSKILTIFLTAVLVAGPGSYLLSKVYQAKSRVLINRNRQPLLVEAILTTPRVPSGIAPKDETSTEAEIFKSPVLAEKLVEQVGAEKVLAEMRWRWDWLRELPNRTRDWLIRGLASWGPTRQVLSFMGIDFASGGSRFRDAVGKILDHLSVEPIRQADVFEAQFIAPDPEFAALVLNTLVRAYLDHQLELHQGKGTQEFFVEEAERLKEELRVARERMQKFKQQWGIVSLQLQTEDLLKRLSKTEVALRQARISAQEADKRIAEIRRQLAAQSQSIPLSTVSDRNPTLDKLRTNLAELELERKQYVEKSPAALQLEAEGAAVRAQIEAEQTKVSGSSTLGVNTTYQELQQTLALEQGKREALQARLDLEKQADAYRQTLEVLDQQEGEYQELALDIEVKAAALELYQKKQEESRINMLLDREKVSYVSPIEFATAPLRPEFPRRKRNLLLGVLIGLLGGVGTAYLCEYCRRSCATKEEAEQILGRPVLASLPVITNDPTATAESTIQLRYLREALNQLNRQKGMRSLLVTSTAVGEGKSYVAMAIARSLSQQGSRVLLIDIDDNSLHSLPQGRLALDMTETGNQSLGEGENLLQPQPTDHSNLYLLKNLNGKEIRYPRLNQIVEIIPRQRDEFDFVMIDGSALGVHPEGLCFAAAADGVLIVVEAERTPAVAVSKTLQMVEEAEGKIIGVVLNKRRYIIPTWVYNWLLTPGRGELAV
jgi:uncharacterized protein involved in exopolysaccharide biosynthesis